ncbi:hypothetical protein E2C01_013567 [Portunus trituberculatus]|uniref:Uncharacterized protein n=1 Tax=Portunus trituberculatus TaxID=210409 RepID=A0A5B7DHE2_PORTR|nr:hypothetical protein [Portunus trituberculatus]
MFTLYHEPKHAFSLLKFLVYVILVHYCNGYQSRHCNFGLLTIPRVRDCTGHGKVLERTNHSGDTRIRGCGEGRSR